MFLATILILIVTYYVFNWYVDYRKGYTRFPGPPRLPLIGSMYLFFGTTPENILKLFLDLHKKYGKAVSGSTLNKSGKHQEYLSFSDAADIEVILTDIKMNNKSSDYDVLRVRN